MYQLLVACSAAIAVVVAVGYFLQQSTQMHHQERAYQERPQRRRRSSFSRMKNCYTERRLTLEYELNSGNLQCSICLSTISSREKIWCCRKGCAEIFHLKCIESWFITSNATCPHCKCDSYNHRDLEYFCFCGQTENPTEGLGSLPHACNRLCPGCDGYCHPGFTQ